LICALSTIFNTIQIQIKDSTHHAANEIHSTTSTIKKNIITANKQLVIAMRVKNNILSVYKIQKFNNKNVITSQFFL
jgi:hypothetical protein